MSYNLIEAKKMTTDIEKQMGLVQFLRHLHRREKLPDAFSVLGLDQLLLDAEDHVEIARIIRNFLAESSEYLYSIFPEPTIYIPVDSRLEENGHPRMYFATGKIIELPDLFGDRLERKRRHWFQAGFNITRG
jgi:F0F1-type ATP synthase beta subunit